MDDAEVNYTWDLYSMVWDALHSSICILVIPPAFLMLFGETKFYEFLPLWVWLHENYT